MAKKSVNEPINSLYQLCCYFHIFSWKRGIGTTKDKQVFFLCLCIKVCHAEGSSSKNEGQRVS